MRGFGLGRKLIVSSVRRNWVEGAACELTGRGPCTGVRSAQDTGLGSFLADKPRFQESGCPGNQTWVEGMEQMLACIPEGNPTPALVCVWNGMIFDLDIPQKATQNHTGTYCCTATNPLGSVSKDIAVVVQGMATWAGRLG